MPPKPKPAKLIRFVDGKEIDNLLTSWDEDKQLLKINRELYDLLPEHQQQEVWRQKQNTELRAINPESKKQ